MSKHKKRKAAGKSIPRIAISGRTKIILLISAACVLVVGGGWWAYFSFTTMAPPDLKVAGSDDVAKFIGSERGLARMSIDSREQYLTQAYQRFSRGEARAQFNQSIRQMSAAEQQVFVDASVEVAKVRFLERAREYEKVPRAQRVQFVDNMIRGLEQMRQQVVGYGPQDNLAMPFKNSMPATTDGFYKTVVTRTSARDRAQAQPLFDAVAARHKELAKVPGAGRPGMGPGL